MSYLDHIKNCNSFPSEEFQPFYIDKICYGLTHNSHIQHLLDWPEVFVADNKGLHLSPALNTPALRTEAVNEVMWSLHQKGVIDSWVGEQYNVSEHFDSPSVMLIERAAVAFLGTRGYGVHLNGLVRKADGIYIWIAVRSLTKPFWPGMLDQIVAGGQPHGLSPLDNMIKESQEEADIPQDVAMTASFEGEIHYCNSGERGIHNDGLFNYDIWLPEDFVPNNTDGEVESFQLMPIEEMAKITDETNEFKGNCNLVNIDLLIRLGLIDESHPDYQQICSLLYAKPSPIQIYT
jgi:hypothetical protein